MSGEFNVLLFIAGMVAGHLVFGPILWAWWERRERRRR